MGKYLLLLIITCFGCGATSQSQQVNLFIKLDNSASDEDYYAIQAAEWWNKQLGCKVFAFNGPAKIIISKRSSKQYPLALGVTKAFENPTKFEIDLSVLLIKQKFPVLHVGVLKHELGHVLGLEHTPKSDKMSIMHPVALSWVKRSKRNIPVIRFTDKSIVNPKQLRMLRYFYCEKLTYQ